MNTSTGQFVLPACITPQDFEAAVSDLVALDGFDREGAVAEAQRLAPLYAAEQTRPPRPPIPPPPAG